MSEGGEGAAARGRGGAWLAGSLAGLSFPELFQLLSATLRTGALELALPPRPPGGEPRLKTLRFRDGQVIWAASTDPADRLGPALQRSGLVPADRLAAAGERVGPRRLGQVLVEEGALSPGSLYDGLVEQVREIVLGLFHEQDGEFTFRDDPTPAPFAVRLPERMRELLAEGARRLAAAGRLAPDEEDEPPRAPAGTSAAVSGPVDTYRQAFKRVFFRMRAVAPDAAARLGSWLERLPPDERPAFEGVCVDESGDVDVARVLVNVAASGRWQGPIARARALAALDAFLAYALFEARNVLPRADADALWRDVAELQGRSS